MLVVGEYLNLHYAQQFYLFKLYSVFQNSILNVIFAEGICNRRVSAFNILCFLPFLVGFIPEK